MPSAPVRLVCLPFAGGGAMAYASLEAGLGGIAEVRVAELPGRGLRQGEAFATDLPMLAGDIAAALTAMPDKPVVLFGHSMGALLAFETARALDAMGDPPSRLVLSGRRPPLTGDGPLAPEALADDALVARMRRLGGSPAALFAQPELLALVLPVVRADYRLVSGYRPAPTAPRLRVDAIILGGSADADNPPGLLSGWSAWLGGALEVEVWPGGHFFIRPHDDRLVALLRDAVAEAAAFG